jgi:hypothetical protein
VYFKNKIQRSQPNKKNTNRNAGAQNVWIWMGIKGGFGILSRTDFMNGRIEKGSHSKSCTRNQLTPHSTTSYSDTSTHCSVKFRI